MVKRKVKMWEQKDAGEAEVGNSTRKVIASWCALCHQWRGLLWVTGGVLEGNGDFAD